MTAGANGGSFSATFTITRSAVFVAQWAGDSGRAGVGSKPLLADRALNAGAARMLGSPLLQGRSGIARLRKP